MNAGRASGKAADGFIGVPVPVDGVLPLSFIDDAPVGLGLIDPKIQWVYINPVFLRMTGLERGQLLGSPVAETPFVGVIAAVLGAAPGSRRAATGAGRPGLPSGEFERARPAPLIVK